MVRKALWWIYGLQAFFLVPMFFGQIARDEMPFWPQWSGDIWFFALDLYLHLIFYAAFYVLPYALLSATYKDSMGHIIAAWVLATMLLFHESILSFVYDMMDGVFDDRLPKWHQWLHILWVAFTVWAIIVWRALSKEKLERRVQEAADELWRRWQASARLSPVAVHTTEAHD